MTPAEGDFVKVTAKRRAHYYDRIGEVHKVDTREGQPYIGVKFEGVDHIVWFFEKEVIVR